jgi:hypothetical protein
MYFCCTVRAYIYATTFLDVRSFTMAQKNEQTNQHHIMAQLAKQLGTQMNAPPNCARRSSLPGIYI